MAFPFRPARTACAVLLIASLPASADEFQPDTLSTTTIPAVKLVRNANAEVAPTATMSVSATRDPTHTSIANPTASSTQITSNEAGEAPAAATKAATLLA